MAMKLMELTSNGSNKNVDAILEAVASGASITRQLLILSRRQLDTEVADLNVILQEVLDLVQPTVGPEVKVLAMWDRTLNLWAPCPAGDIQQVLLNLINNARDAMPRGGSIHILMELTKDGRIRIRVEDDGDGFSKEALEQIFEPYFTTKSEGKGTGLGLAMAQAIIERSGGTIAAANRSDGKSGASFDIHLPRHQPKAEQEETETGMYRRGWCQSSYF